MNKLYHIHSMKYNSQQLSWLLYDPANAAYALIVRTVFAPLFLGYCAKGIYTDSQITSYWSICASAAGIAGLLGFAGLIAPHTMRLLSKSGSNKFIIPASALAGAVLVLAGDYLGQLLSPEAMEIPAGVLLSGCGALFFIILLCNSREETL